MIVKFKTKVFFLSFSIIKLSEIVWFNSWQLFWFQLHFIFRHKNPKTGEIEEKHAKKPAGNLEKYFTDKKTHLYTLGMLCFNLWTFGPLPYNCLY